MERVPRYRSRGTDYEIFRLDAVTEGHVSRLPYSLKVLLENLLRHEDGRDVSRDDIEALANWDPKAEPEPGNLVYPEPGHPAGLYRGASRRRSCGHARRGRQTRRLGGRHQPAVSGGARHRSLRAGRSLRARGRIWSSTTKLNSTQRRTLFVSPLGPGRFRKFQGRSAQYRHRPPGQPRIPVPGRLRPGRRRHNTAPTRTPGRDRLAHDHGEWPRRARLGRRWHRGRSGDAGPADHDADPAGSWLQTDGQACEGTTATDLVLTVTEMLRNKGVVGKFVEFFGDGLPTMPLADRATLGNMSPEFGSTCAHFPDRQRNSGIPEAVRPPRRPDRTHRSLCARAGMWREPGEPDALYTDVLELDLANVVPSIAGPKRPQDRIALNEAGSAYRRDVAPMVAERGDRARHGVGQQRRRELRTHRWGRPDRGDHQLHEYLEPGRYGRRRSAGHAMRPRAD